MKTMSRGLINTIVAIVLHM